MAHPKNIYELSYAVVSCSVTYAEYVPTFGVKLSCVFQGLDSLEFMIRRNHAIILRNCTLVVKIVTVYGTFSTLKRFSFYFRRSWKDDYGKFQILQVSFYP